MRRGSIRVVELAGSPRERGLAHGERLATEIRAYADERMELVCQGRWNGRPIERTSVLALAEQCVPAHEAYSPELMAELRGLADAIGRPVAEVIAAGGFTDFVDVVYGRLGDGLVAEDDCTAVLVSDERAAGRGFIAQTWDMHASALDRVVLLDIRPAEGPRALVLSTAGCLGQIGMNDAGICVGINNLPGADGSPGVTWPVVVRKALLARDIEDALACITEAQLAGAHNYLLLDALGRGYNVEAFTTVSDVTELDVGVVAHTNHALAQATREVSQQKPAELQASSEARLRIARGALQSGMLELEDLIELTRHPTVCYAAAPPLELATCGATIMRPRSLDFWACWGPPDVNEYEHFSLAQTAA